MKFSSRSASRNPREIDSTVFPVNESPCASKSFVRPRPSFLVLRDEVYGMSRNDVTLCSGKYVDNFGFVSAIFFIIRVYKIIVHYSRVSCKDELFFSP